MMAISPVEVGAAAVLALNSAGNVWVGSHKLSQQFHKCMIA
jgi:hypothetical protein